MKFCSKCGDPIEAGEKFCNKCGNPLDIATSTNVQQNNLNSGQLGNNSQSFSNTPYQLSFQQQQMNNMSQQNLNQQINGQPNYSNVNAQYLNNYHNSSGTNGKKGLFIGIGIGAGLLVVLIFGLVLKGGNSNKYYFDTNPHENNEEIVQVNNGTATKKGKYSTAIIYDNTYSGVKISKKEDAYKLISKDSVSQKNNCPSEIKKIEEQIIKDYGLTAVNLCEMDVEFAKEIGNVIKKIYYEYPSARGYITNLSLANVSMTDGYIAAFMPVFNFATSDSSSTYPWVIKTQVLLNTSYFLNIERLQMSVIDGSNVGHFPLNATMYSPVAHEFGHYLSFLAMMKNYDMNSLLLVDGDNVNTFYKVYSDFSSGDYSLQMINEAFEKYKKDTNATVSLDEWRGTISKYALAKDNSGNYIYDETIAESFHDVYLNGDNAATASKYVVAVLKSKLEG